MTFISETENQENEPVNSVEDSVNTFSSNSEEYETVNTLSSETDINTEESITLLDNSENSRPHAIAVSQVTVSDVTDAYSAILSNDSYTFVVDANGVESGSSCVILVNAYCGSQPLSDIDISYIECPEGVSAEIRNNNTSAPEITFTVTNAFTESCEAIITIIVDDVTINKKFTFTVTKNGDHGRGIKTVVTTYQTSSGGVIIPEGEWLIDIPETSALEPYLWTRTVTTYTDDTTSTSYSVGSTIKGVEEDINALKQQVSMAMTESDVTIKIQNEIKNELNNGVSKVVTETGFTFDNQGMTVDATGSTTKTQVTTDGMSVYNKSGSQIDPVLVANSNGVEAKNLNASTFLIVGNRSRFENYGADRTGCFWIGG